MARKSIRRSPHAVWLALFLAAAMVKLCTAQTTGTQATSLGRSVEELQRQVRDLQAAVAEIRHEAAEYRAETRELRKELAAARTDSNVSTQSVSTGQYVSPQNEVPTAESDSGELTAQSASQPAGSDRLARLEEEYQLLTGKIDEQYQTKVESASKYRVRLSGIVLLNLFSNAGRVDNIDFPSVARQQTLGSSGGSFGGTLRQSQLGLEVFGPRVGGARTSADIQLDLAGGSPNALNGVNTGLMRLRTGVVRMDWARTSIVAGQDALFFSPQTPTSFASLAVPALSYAGNLWSWSPQVRVEHNFLVTENSRLTVQGGILDPVSGEPPTSPTYRQPQAGEASRQPAFGSRVAWSHTVFGQPLTLGLGGYYSRQDYEFGRKVDGWAGMADWDLPLGARLALSGKFYRGRALGGLGGAIGRSVLFSGPPASPDTAVQGLNAIGGWAQLKAKATSKLEFNVAFGQDNPYAADVRLFPYSQAYFDPTLVRNQGVSGNVIFRPRSDLLLSAEYRHYHTFDIRNDTYTADHVNMMIGILF